MENYHIESEDMARICLSGRERYTSDFTAKDILYVKMKSNEQTAAVNKAELEGTLAVKDVLAAVSVLDLPGLEKDTCFAPMTELAAAAGETELAAAKGSMKIMLDLEIRENSGVFRCETGNSHGGVEPYTTIAIWQEDQLMISTSTVYASACRNWVAHALDIEESRIKIISPTVGGFEGRSDHYCREALCALLAKRTGRPVRYEITRKLAWESIGGKYDLY